MTVSPFQRSRFLFCALLGLLSLLLLPVLAAGQGIPINNLVSSTGIVYRSAVSVEFPNAQVAGGLNVVVVGWGDSSSTITSVTDTNGNAYFQAAGSMNPIGFDVSQAIFIAPNIKAGVNTVTVTFNAYTVAQDVRLIEYSGPPFLENTTNPFDTWIGATGGATTAATGTMTTTYSNDVLDVGGTGTGDFTTVVSSCGTGCTLIPEIPPTSPFFDITADALVSAAGAYQAQVNTDGGSNWVLQMIALRVAGQTTIVNPAPTATSVVPATSPEAGGVSIAITGTGFLPGANVSITGTVNSAPFTVSAVNCVVASTTTINCMTPVFATSATGTTLVVTNPDLQQATLPFAYTQSTPFTVNAGNFSPVGGSVNGGTHISITGSDFASGATVTIGGVRADQYSVLDSGTIRAVTPAGSAGAQTITVQNPSGANGTPGQFTYSPGAGINFVQASSAQPNFTSIVDDGFNLPQTAGDLNVVVIGWGDTTSSIQSVTDTANNTYVAAVPTTQGTGLSQAIYYAKNINAATNNEITVRFNTAPASPDLRIVEYSGLDTVNPVDGSAGASGTGTFLDSGPVSPTSVGDMILAAGTVGGGITPALGKACADNSCQFSTAIYTPAENNVIHAFPTVAGPFDGTANQTPSVPWVMQAVAFRLPGGSQPSFTVGATALSPASITAGSSATSTVTVTPSNGFTSAVALTCSNNLPTGAACNFNPASVTPGGSPVTSALTITTTSATPASTTTVTITGTSGSVVNTTTVSLVVTSSTGGGGNFTLTANPTSQAVSPGGSGTSTITINPTGGFNGTVALTCSVAPSPSLAPVCSLPASATTTATLTVTTTAPTAALRRSSSIFYAMLLPLGGITLLGVSFGSRRKKVLGVLLVFLMASGLLFLASCSSGSSSTPSNKSGTPAGAYTVTVTGTSGSLAAQTTTFTLTVN